MPVVDSRPAPRASLLLAAGAAATLLLSACGGSQPDGSSAAATTTSSTAVPSGAAAGAELSISDTWVKANEGTEELTMTGVFGVVTNDTDQPLTIVSATNSVSPRTELHEMAMENGAMVMRPIDGGISVPAGGTTALAPGGLHVMILDLAEPVRAGDDVTVTLTADDGSTLEFTALAKSFAGANESYSPSTGAMTDMSGMDMSGMDMSTSGMQMSADSTTPSAGG